MQLTLRTESYPYPIHVGSQTTFADVLCHSCDSQAPAGGVAVCLQRRGAPADGSPSGGGGGPVDSGRRACGGFGAGARVTCRRRLVRLLTDPPPLPLPPDSRGGLAHCQGLRGCRSCVNDAAR
jgi:hypothetical protein